MSNAFPASGGRALLRKAHFCAAVLWLPGSVHPESPALLGASAGKAKQGRAVRTLNDEEPLIEYDPHFLTDDETDILMGMGREMKFHASHSLEPAQKLVYLPINHTYEYASDSGDVEFHSTDYSEEQMETLGRFYNLTDRWTRVDVANPLDAPVRVFRPVAPIEDVHLDVHLSPHRLQTVVTFLEDSADAVLIFPCVETEDMSSREWRHRQNLCAQAFRTLDSAHARLVDQLEYGILHENEQTRMDYLVRNPAVGLLNGVFKEDEASRQRHWNWAWTDNEEENLPDDRQFGLKFVVDTVCENWNGRSQEHAEKPSSSGEDIRGSAKRLRRERSRKEEEEEGGAGRKDSLSSSLSTGAPSGGATISSTSSYGAVGKGDAASSAGNPKNVLRSPRHLKTVGGSVLPADFAMQALTLPVKKGAAVKFEVARSNKRNERVLYPMGWHALCAKGRDKPLIAEVHKTAPAEVLQAWKASKKDTLAERMARSEKNDAAKADAENEDDHEFDVFD